MIEQDPIALNEAEYGELIEDKINKASDANPFLSRVLVISDEQLSEFDLPEIQTILIETMTTSEIVSLALYHYS